MSRGYTWRNLSHAFDSEGETQEGSGGGRSSSDMHLSLNGYIQSSFFRLLSLLQEPNIDGILLLLQSFGLNIDRCEGGAKRETRLTGSICSARLDAEELKAKQKKRF